MREGEPIIGIRDSNPSWVLSIRRSLEQVGYQVALDPGIVDLLSKNALNLLLLGIGSESGSPQNVVADLRKLTSIAFIAFGHIDTPSFKAAVLDAGADDYLLKEGLDSRELLARVRVQLRRPNRSFRDQPFEIIRNGDLSIDLTGMEVTIGEKSVSLTPTEFRLLRYLAQNLDHIIPNMQLLKEVWGSENRDLVLVKMYAKGLRDKIEEDAKHPRYIVNRRGFGYVMPNYNQPKVDFSLPKL